MTEDRTVDRWEDVGSVDLFDDQEGREVKIGARLIAVFRLGERYYAIKNICPHQAEPLHYGQIQTLEDQPSVQCAAHGWCFSLETGKCLWGAPGCRVASYPVRVEKGRVLLGI